MDIISFAEMQTYLDRRSKLQQLQTTAKQKMFLHATDLNLNTVARLTRQTGFSTAIHLAIAYKLSNYSHKKIAFIGNKNALSVMAINAIHSYLNPHAVRKYTQNRIEMKNGSTVEILSSVSMITSDVNHLRHKFQGMDAPYSDFFIDHHDQTSDVVIDGKVEEVSTSFNLLMTFEHPFLSDNIADTNIYWGASNFNGNCVKMLINRGYTLVDFEQPNYELEKISRGDLPPTELHLHKL